MWWQDNWQGHFGTTQDGGTSRHLFLLTRVMKQCGTRPKSGSPFHIVSSLSLYDTRRKAIIMTGSACRRILPEDDVHKEWVTIYPPGRHWLDLDIQHSWHQNDSAPYHNVFFPRRLLFLFLLPQYFCEISCRSWGHALSQTNRETQAWKTEDYFLALLDAKATEA